jgi:aminopeptidase N
MLRKIFSIIVISLITLGYLNAQNDVYSGGAWKCYNKRINNPKYFEVSDKSLNSPKHSYDVQKYKLYFDIYNCYISPYPKSFTAKNEITFRVDTALNYIKLNAVNTSIVIDSVRLAGVSFTHTNNILTINLDRTYNPNETVVVRVCYHHQNVSDNAFYVSNGFVFTDSEPEGARKWFPCWDKPSDKALTDITARVPATVKLCSNGRLADSIKTADTIYYHWVSRDPVATYLTILTSKVNYNLSIVNWTNPNTSEVIPIRFYYNTGENMTNLNAMKAAIIPMTTLYSQKFGDHPFEKNGFATLNNQFTWGGMENQTLTSLCPNCWDESLLAHEFAHQWFGDMITCATWADIWLNEGFATFVEALWTENKSGYNAYKAEINSNASYYLSNNPGWAISVPDWAINTPNSNILFNYAITYMKGCCVLHQLRYVMGDVAFFNAIKQYAIDIVEFKYKTATIGDFLTKINAVSGQNLDYFINEWIYQPNHPNYQNLYNFMNLGGGNWQVNFLAKQTNTYFYKMPIEIKIFFTNSTDTTIKVMNDVNNQFFGFQFNKQPNNIQFDPNNNIVLKTATLALNGINDNFEMDGFRLFQNEPNPASGITDIKYHLKENSIVQISLFDVKGNLIKVLVDQETTTGEHRLKLDCNQMVPGVYYYRMDAGDFTMTKKLIVIK